MFACHSLFAVDKHFNKGTELRGIELLLLLLLLLLCFPGTHVIVNRIELN
jgi:hypothetical protein